MHHPWQPVIGLEIHAQLNTRSKLFSTAPNRFGDAPNTNLSAICSAQPGALPILNQAAVQKALLFGLSVGATISLVSTFDRKSYFYPDSPRNFQITQYENPLMRGGHIVTPVGTFPLQRAHLEEDAGTIKHFSTYAGIDYNRAGAPLLEIVSEPCFRSAKEAVSFAMAVRTLLLYLDISDGQLEEGSFRIDANISIKQPHETHLRPSIEIKNLNSFSFLESAIQTEIERQIRLYTEHPKKAPQELIPPGTYRFDPKAKETILMRTKESADDYRYFPEPDLVPIVLQEEDLATMRLQLPELPHHRLKRYQEELGLSPQAALLLTQEKKLADYFEEALQHYPSPRLLCNWITVEFAGRLKAKALFQTSIPPLHLAKLIRMIDKKQITGPMAKSIADAMIEQPHLDPEKLVHQNPHYKPLHDTKQLEQQIDLVIQEHPQSVLDYKKGQEKALSFLVGQVLKKTNGKALPEQVLQILKKKLK